jgi:tetratricopeptide (TPR) repeat protein
VPLGELSRAFVDHSGRLHQRIAAADNLLSKYKDTQFKSIALQMAGESYAQKGDGPNAIVYGDRAIEADPKNFQALLLVSSQLARMTKEFDLDKDEKLKQASKLANDAITTINAAAKPNPQLPDDQWASIKKDMVSQAHETLGVIASIDKKWDTAITEFKTAIDEAAHVPAGTNDLPVARRDGPIDAARRAVVQRCPVVCRDGPPRTT